MERFEQNFDSSNVSVPNIVSVPVHWCFIMSTVSTDKVGDSRPNAIRDMLKTSLAG